MSKLIGTKFENQILSSLEESDKKILLNTIWESTTEYSVVASALDGSILAWNSGATQNYGYPADEILGKNLLITCTEKDIISGNLQLIFDEVYETGKWEGELTRIRNDGSEFQAFVTITLRLNDQGDPIGFTMISHALTASQKMLKDLKKFKSHNTTLTKQLLEQTAFLKDILETSTGYSFIALDLDGSILAWNKGAKLNYGYSSEEMVGLMNIKILHIPEDITTGKYLDMLNEALIKGRFFGECEQIRKNGERFIAELTINLRKSPNGTSLGFVLISRDMTEQKKLETQLREQNDEVQEANRRKSEFLANMSHELRTPLNGIIGFSELMYNEKVGPISTEHKEYLGDILSSAKHLLQLINDVLDLSKVESGKMQFHPEPVNITKMVQEVTDILRTMIANKHIKLTTNIDPSLTDIVTDPSKFKQVLYNYISNAIKYTPEKGKVLVTALPCGKDRFRVEVIDSGIGIRVEDAEKLFNEFQQLEDAVSKQYHGTGLGLSLTKRIIEAQGGEVGVTSELGKGSCFYAILPRKQKIKKVSVAKTRKYLNQLQDSLPTILIIEDEVADQNYLSTMMINAGYAVKIARTGKEAIHLAKNKTFQAITLDLILPDMNGLEVLREIREDSVNQDVPIIIITVVAEKFAGFKIHDYFVKPVVTDKLLTSLTRAKAYPGSSKSVLVIDDDMNSLKLAMHTLSESGYKVTVKANATDGIMYLEKSPPDAIILDLLMPDINGFEFLKCLTSQTEYRQIPVIIWTVKDLSPDETELLSSAAQKIIRKDETTTQDLVTALAELIPLQRGKHAQ